MTKHIGNFGTTSKTIRGVPGIRAREGPADCSLSHAIGVPVYGVASFKNPLEHPRLVNGFIYGGTKRGEDHQPSIT